MATFWAVAAALLLLAMALLAGALRRAREPASQTASRAASHTASQANLEVLRAQLGQLGQDFAAGTIDAAQHRASRAEIERRVLEEESVAGAPDRGGSPRGTLALLTLAVPVLALALYAQLGNREALRPEAAAARADPAQQDIEALVAKLAERMERQPPGQVADAEGWTMLGRTYAALQRYPEAGRAFGRALQLTPDNAQLLADQADVMAMLHGQSLEGEPLRLIERALQIDPGNLKALALAGSAAFQRKDYAAAMAHWGKAMPLAPQGSEFAVGLERSIADARAAAAQAGTAAPRIAAAAPGADAVARKDGGAGAEARAGSGAGSGTTGATQASVPAAAAGAGAIRGRVSIAPALAAKVSPGDTVFVFARAEQGPRMPLAIVRRSASELPLRFTLDDSTAMSPELKLSKFDKVIIGARISKSGDAMPQSGDLQGQLGPIGRGGGEVELVIDGVRP